MGSRILVVRNDAGIREVVSNYLRRSLPKMHRTLEFLGSRSDSGPSTRARHEFLILARLGAWLAFFSMAQICWAASAQVCTSTVSVKVQPEHLMSVTNDVAILKIRLAPGNYRHIMGRRLLFTAAKRFVPGAAIGHVLHSHGSLEEGSRAAALSRIFGSPVQKRSSTPAKIADLS